jgi:hypothetical protein
MIPRPAPVLAAAALLLAALPALARDARQEPRVLLAESFDGENDGRAALMYAGFSHWAVEDGTVDLVGARSEWDFVPGHGLYVDLDGDRPDGVHFDAGRLVSREAFALAAGRYELRFRLAGSHRGDTNTVLVTLGDAYHERITLPSHAGFEEYVRAFPVHAPQRGRLSFENLGSDGYGLLLDDVRLVRLSPAP